MWDQVRRPVIERAAGRCEVCGDDVPSRMICHERWLYDDEALEARLRELVGLCGSCSRVVHWGNSQALADAGKINMARVWSQFLRINGIDREAGQRHLERAFALWRQRSQRSWTLDYGEFTELVRLHGRPPQRRW